MTDLSAAGINPDWPSVSASGHALTFADYSASPDGMQADQGEVYVIQDLQARIQNILDGTEQAISSTGDPRLTAIRTTESGNFAHMPPFNENNELNFFTEDWNMIEPTGPRLQLGQPSPHRISAVLTSQIYKQHTIHW